MSSSVTWKITALDECFVTHFTYIGPFPCVNSHMILQNIFMFKSFPTNWAGMRLLLGMSFHVIIKAASMTKCFNTEGACVRALTCMNCQVLSQVSFLSESFSTSGALMWGLLWMSFHVTCKTALGKCFVTHFTNIRSFPCVNSQMYSQSTFIFKPFSTGGALMGHLLWIICHVEERSNILVELYKCSCLNFNQKVAKILLHCSPSRVIYCQYNHQYKLSSFTC